MAQFPGSRCHCIDDDCSAFDQLVSTFKPPSADEVINHSEFCVSFQLDQVEGSVGALT